MASKKQERYTYLQLAEALTNAVQAKKGADAEAYSYDDICTLVRCWTEHPKFPSPRPNTVISRETRTDGAGYLQLSEITSFQIYAGYNLLKYL